MADAKPITCAHSIPSDDVWDEDTLIRPSGEAASRILAGLLSNGGYSTAEPEPDFEHESWTFDATKDDASIWVQVTDLDETELIVSAQEMRGCVWPIGGSGKAEALLDFLQEAMEQDSRFNEIERLN